MIGSFAKGWIFDLSKLPTIDLDFINLTLANVELGSISNSIDMGIKYITTERLALGSKKKVSKYYKLPVIRQ